VKPFMPESIETGDLVLRRYRPGEGAAIAGAVCESGRQLSRYETWAHAAFTEEEGRDYAAWWDRAWEESNARYFGIWRDDRYLGSVGLSEISLEHRTAALGFWVRSADTGQGVATTAAAAVVEAGFEHLGLQRVELMAAVDNAASLRVAHKIGARHEGILRKRQLLEGMPTDCSLSAIVR